MCLPSIDSQSDGNKPPTGKRPSSDTKRKTASKSQVVSWQREVYCSIVSSR